MIERSRVATIRYALVSQFWTFRLDGGWDFVQLGLRSFHFFFDCTSSVKSAYGVEHVKVGGRATPRARPPYFQGAKSHYCAIRTPVMDRPLMTPPLEFDMPIFGVKEERYLILGAEKLPT